MNREIAAKFPSGIKALIVDDDARFISGLVREPYTAALKLLSGDNNKGVDVVLVNAEKASNCGFDFRGIVETDLRIPVIYFLSRHHVATGDEADELLRTLWASTYVLRAPLEAKDVCDLWMVIAWRKCYLDNKAKGLAAADPSRRVVPAAVQELMAGAGGDSTVDEERDDDDGRIHFKVVGARGRRRKRKSSSNFASSSSSSSAGITMGAEDQPAKRQGKMNQQQQPAPQNHRAPAAALPLVRQRQHQPSATSVEATATTSRARWNQPAAGQPDVVCPPLMFGPFPYQGPRPPVLKQAIPGPATIVRASAADADAGEYGNAASSLLRFLKHAGTETEPHGHDKLAAMMAWYRESNPPVTEAAGTEALHNYNNSSALMAPQQHQQQHIGHGQGVAANRAEDMEYALHTNSYIINYSTAAAVAPQHVAHGVAPEHAVATEEVVLNNNNADDFSTYDSTSPMNMMAPNQVLDIASNVNELTMAGGGAIFSNANDDGASFAVPQDLAAAAPDGGQLAPGTLDAISASLMGSPPGHGAGMDGNAGIELEEMFSPDQYENTVFPLEALLGLGDAPVYEAGDDDYQQGGAAGGIAADAAGTTSLVGGAAGDNLDILDHYLFVGSTGDNNGRE